MMAGAAVEDYGDDDGDDGDGKGDDLRPADDGVKCVHRAEVSCDDLTLPAVGGGWWLGCGGACADRPCASGRLGPGAVFGSVGRLYHRTLSRAIMGFWILE